MCNANRGWANYNGINDNGQVKSADIPTFLEKAMDMGLSASFTTSWREHTSTTYREDIIKHTSKGYPVVYKHGGDDEATLYTMLEYTSMPKSGDGNGFDPDVMFFTFEHADHAGHGSGFGNWNENYVKETKKCDEYGMAILNSIYGRESYEQEDWLIIIVTDHGGKGTNHGGQSLRERTTWFACNKAELVNADELKNFAIPPKSSIVQG